jgi:hypothetical protein
MNLTSVAVILIVNNLKLVECLSHCWFVYRDQVHTISSVHAIYAIVITAVRVHKRTVCNNGLYGSMEDAWNQVYDLPCSKAPEFPICDEDFIERLVLINRTSNCVRL